MSGSARAADDIEEVVWLNIEEMSKNEAYMEIIVPEHLDFFSKLLNFMSNS